MTMTKDMTNTMVLTEEDLETVSGGRREGHYDYVPDSCGGTVGQYDIKVGGVYWRNDAVADCAHFNNHWARVVVEKVWEEPHSFLFIHYTERMVTYINTETGERVTRVADGALNYVNN